MAPELRGAGLIFFQDDALNATPTFATRNAADPAFWDERFEQGFTPWDMHGVPMEFQAFIAREMKTWGEIIAKAGITPS